MATIGATGPAQAAELDEDSAWSAWCRTVDHGSIFACLLLFAIGVVLAFAATPQLALKHELPAFHYAWRQMLLGAPAFFLLFLFSFFGASAVRSLGATLFLVGLAGLALLPFYGVAHGKEAIRWFSIAGVSLQPVEIVKPGLVIISALTLSALRHPDRAVALGGVLISLLALGVTVGLLASQPDYGQSALVVAIWCVIFFAAGGSVLLLFGVGALAAAGGAVAYSVAPHVAARIDNFLDPIGAAQQQIQAAESAFIQGGWFGRGLGQGVENASVPDAHSDFILAVAAEEYGFVLVAFIMALFCVIVLRAITRLWRAEDAFVRLAALGLAMLIGVQAAVNIAVAARMAPITGMTLPFVSYGGTSMLASGMTVGLLLALTKRRSGEFLRLFER